MLVVGQQTLNRLGWSLGLSVGVFKAESAHAAGQLGEGGGCGSAGVVAQVSPPVLSLAAQSGSN